MKNKLALLLFAVSIAACKSDDKNGSASAPSATSASTPASSTVPEVYKAKFTTTKGDFVIEAHRAWAPKGADRFYELVKGGYFDGVPFFRAIDGFMVQFGISSDPAANKTWSEARIQDDPAAGQSNERGKVTFATSGPDSRTTQVFINYGNNSRLDSMGFTPFGQVVEGMTVVDSFYKEYGEGAPRGPGPNQDLLQNQGAAYWKASFPKLDSVKSAKIQ
jgi:peptidyl-prolyl cis-trans isomerase A (cyclophilin A)